MNFDEAIRKRMNYINDRSRNKDREYCGMVCKERLCKTNEIVYLTTQVRGNKTDCEPKNAPCPRFTYPVAVWHTHGKDDPKYDNEHLLAVTEFEKSSIITGNRLL